MALSFAVAIFLLNIFSSPTVGKTLPKIESDNHWDYLVLAHFWPPSSCIYFKEHGDSCYIPSIVKGWTIHGLWPSREDSNEFPQNCNDSMQFNYTQIEGLRSSLDRNWHYYKKDADPTFLWNHEWTKHGTCAYSLPELQGELKYFNKTLGLHSHINLMKALEKGGIVPSTTKTYNRNDFNKAVSQYFHFSPVIVCDYDSDVKKTYLDQIYLCFNKSFHLRNCVDPSTKKNAGVTFFDKCLEQDEIYYLPLDADNEKSSISKTSLIFQSEKSKH